MPELLLAQMLYVGQLAKLRPIVKIGLPGLDAPSESGVGNAAQDDILPQIQCQETR